MAKKAASGVKSTSDTTKSTAYNKRNWKALNSAETIWFYSKNSIFSNFGSYGFTCNGSVRYNTVEHYFQACKFPYGSEEHLTIAMAATPREAKRLGGPHGFRMSSEDTETWNTRRVDVMRDALLMKAEQNDEWRAALLETGTRWLVEDSPRDYFWGCGARGTGVNMLGQLLMELRAHLADRD
ncbi:protein of unknown function (DUF1768) [Carpediemonas membranifera]|uniref:NADAR domain-containing protein n=1 Tax=Carpediemonas membranifera TaxID=201153 RepID=A0A8J6ATE3_9EUKA|nr:protein of unknown function (DUF1768) [Carpediemonas membranifera]|eukprot:KAG9391940.1 protein of unknown function (DUF1768) [Carpediemonas membranifera]